MTKHISARKRKLRDGRIALYFDYYKNRKRILKHTELYLLPGEEKDARIRVLNRRTLEEFEIRKAKELTDQRQANAENAEINRRRYNFFNHFHDFLERHPTKERRANAVMRKLYEYNGDNDFLPLIQITERWVEGFYNYLCKTLKHETPYDYFKYFSRVLKDATKAKLFSINPADAVTIKRPSNAHRDVLTMEEIAILAATPCQIDVVKRAFLFSCVTGLRYCDVKAMRWSDISIDNTLTILQAKTHKLVCFTLTSDALHCAGERGATKDFVFPLPSNVTTNKALREWVKKAGISKGITYHCARHSAGTNFFLNGVDALKIAAILGHTSLKHTTRYVRMNPKALGESAALLPQVMSRVTADGMTRA